MYNLIYIDWEGRSYETADWLKDRAIARNMLGDGPHYVTQYDVGIIVSNNPVTATDSFDMTYLSKGDHEPYELEEMDENEMEYLTSSFTHWEKVDDINLLESIHPEWFN